LTQYVAVFSGVGEYFLAQQTVRVR
jgi:hypothetical protein